MASFKTYSRESDMEITPLLERTVTKRKVLQPSRGRKIVILSVCLWLQMVSVGIGYGLGIMYVEMIRVFQAARSDAALVQSIYLGLMVGGGILYTGIIRRYGPGVCVICGSVIAFLGLFVSSFAINLAMVIVFTGVVGGLGTGLLYLGSFITVSWTFHENPGVPLVIVTIGSSLGQFAIPYFLEILIEEYSWIGAFQIISALALNTVAFGLIIYTSRRFYNTGSDEKEARLTDLCDVTLLKDPMIVFILSCCINLSLTGPIESWFFADIMVIRGYERSTGSFFVTLTGIANIIGRVTGALLRFYVKFLLQISRAPIGASVSNFMYTFRIPTLYHWIYLCPIIAAAHILVVYLYDYWPLFGATLLYGIPFGVTVAQVPAIMYEAAGLSRYPRAIALMNLMYGIGNFCGGVMGGLIKDVTGSYDVMFFIAVGSSMYIAIATVVVVIIKKYYTSSKTYKSPQVEYSSIEDSQVDEEETSLSTKLLNGSVVRHNSYASARYSTEDGLTSSTKRLGSGNYFYDFDMDTASVMYGSNSEHRTETSLFSKTL